MYWLLILVASSSIFFGSTVGRLEACYECTGNSSCSTSKFNTSEDGISVADCLAVYRNFNTTEAVCVKLSVYVDSSVGDIFARFCAPKEINNTKFCDALTTNNTYWPESYKQNISMCTTCTSDFCNSSPNFLGSIAVLFSSTFAVLSLIY